MTHDWRMTVPGANGAAELRKWIKDRLVQLERGEMLPCRDALRAFRTRVADGHAWNGVPRSALDGLARSANAAADALQASREDPERAQDELERALAEL